jgi:hypothetical protein
LIRETGQRTIRGNTPKIAKEIYELLKNMPPTAKAIFYDGKKQYYKGVPPFAAIDKEISNVMGGMPVYTMTDNRILSRNQEFVPRPVKHPESDLMSIAEAIARQASFLNKYVINYNELRVSHAPAPIKPPEEHVPNLAKMKVQPPKRDTGV